MVHTVFRIDFSRTDFPWRLHINRTPGNNEPQCLTMYDATLKGSRLTSFNDQACRPQKRPFCRSTKFKEIQRKFKEFSSKKPFLPKFKGFSRTSHVFKDFSRPVRTMGLTCFIYESWSHFDVWTFITLSLPRLKKDILPWWELACFV